MDSDNEIQKHITYRSGDEVAKICSPLLNHFQINYFAYLRKYPDGSIALLNSNKDWVLNYFRKQYPILVNHKEIYNWPTCMPHHAIADAAFNFNFHNGVVLENKHHDYIEMIEMLHLINLSTR